VSCAFVYVHVQHPFITLIVGCYAILVGLGVLWWESNYGESRGPSRFPLRALVYLALSIFCFWYVSTILPGAMLLCTALANFVAAVLMKEKYTARAESAAAAAEQQSDLLHADSFCSGLVAWAVMLKQQNKRGSIVFMLIYFLGNTALFAWTVNDWQLLNAAIQPLQRLSDWGPWAKGFGALLDLNCALIVLPVSRTLLRMLYNKSTADQGCVSRSLRAVLQFIPLDQNITFHKIIAYVILLSVIGHVTLHMINLAFAWHNTLVLFGGGAWITGGVICLWMFIIYTSVMAQRAAAETHER